MRLALVMAFLMVGCGAPATSTPSSVAHEIHGTFRLSNGEEPDRSAGCAGTGGYSDVAVGTEVVVKNADGTIVGTSSLAVDQQGPEPAGSGAYQCGFAFVVSGLPESAFYTVSVGDRGDQTFSKADLAAKGWTVSLSLGP
jgi:hypothetical protein